jgi:hypothetical protein
MSTQYLRGVYTLSTQLIILYYGDLGSNPLSVIFFSC